MLRTRWGAYRAPHAIWPPPLPRTPPRLSAFQISLAPTSLIDTRNLAVPNRSRAASYNSLSVVNAHVQNIDCHITYVSNALAQNIAEAAAGRQLIAAGRHASLLKDSALMFYLFVHCKHGRMLTWRFLQAGCPGLEL